jgi:peroxiredoxin
MKVSKKSFAVLTGILICVLLLTLAGCASSALHINGPAPGFTLKDLNGQSVSLSSLKGKYVLLHFWDYTFQPCVDELPAFQKINDEWSQNGRAVLITIDANNSPEAVKTFMQKNNFTFKVLLDNQFSTAEKYEVQYVPANFLIGPDGFLKLNIGGVFRDKEALDRALQGYLP